MLPPRLKKTVMDNPKKLANLIDLVNLPSILQEFVGQSQISRLGCFMRVWSYIKTNNLQVTPNSSSLRFNSDDFREFTFTNWNFGSDQKIMTFLWLGQKISFVKNVTSD